ncbi:tRNA (adenosine(37)-N6)-threonylcarbamoyltransferase complex transferase subunit TsaD [Patescibacteria group bacterium]|nr:tRNA (adenosine(37)-N6)-threonylcarbamoyltransferase complex transferase subunit TsaD [Patescibacteria group bacterium]
MPRAKTILAIETSCDETALALVRCSGGLRAPKFVVEKSLISSQIAIHRPFGGVVPNLAKREHLKNLPKLFKRIGGSAVMKKIDAIAVTVGPGLEPALWTGITFAQELAKKYDKPLIGANHMEGHLYSALLPMQKPTAHGPLPTRSIKFPAIALVVSGGHTILLRMTAMNKWTVLGETLDDAAGEAFDKVARIIGLPYPGGPEIQKIAATGDPNAIKFPRPMLNKKNYEFSFSGLKTSVLYYLRDNPKANKANVAASFQEAAVDVLNKKTKRAAEEYKAKTIILCGGVSANKPLQERLRTTADELRAHFIVPDFHYNTDNAAMIAAAAYLRTAAKKKKLRMEAQGMLSL